MMVMAGILEMPGIIRRIVAGDAVIMYSLRIYSISSRDDQNDDKHRYASVASPAIMIRMMISIATRRWHLQLCLT